MLFGVMSFGVMLFGVMSFGVMSFGIMSIILLSVYRYYGTLDARIKGGDLILLLNSVK